MSVYTVTATGDLGGFATTTFTDATPISNHFSQAANGYNPFTGVAEWIGGILNAQKTTYKEGMSSPQRLVIDTGPAASPVTLDDPATPDVNEGGYRSYTFGIALLDGGSYAYDFPTGSSTLNTQTSQLWGQSWADAAFKGFESGCR